MSHVKFQTRKFLPTWEFKSKVLPRPLTDLSRFLHVLAHGRVSNFNFDIGSASSIFLMFYNYIFFRFVRCLHVDLNIRTL